MVALVALFFLWMNLNFFLSGVFSQAETEEDLRWHQTPNVSLQICALGICVEYAAPVCLPMWTNPKKPEKMPVF